jgi:hypothetical protein
MFFLSIVVGLDEASLPSCFRAGRSFGQTWDPSACRWRRVKLAKSKIRSFALISAVWMSRFGRLHARLQDVNKENQFSRSRSGYRNGQRPLWFSGDVVAPEAAILGTASDQIDADTAGGVESAIKCERAKGFPWRT